MPGTLLAIFAKFWQPGEVKTRLAATIGSQAAARLHRAFVEALVLRMAGAAERCVLAYTPTERRGEFAELLRDVAARGRESISSPPPVSARPRAILATESTPDPFTLPPASWWLLTPQSPGDLGKRMEHFFQASLAEGADRVVLIGSDSPTLPTQYVRQAFDELLRREIVLGPSEDGGYYLIGLRAGPAVGTKGANSTGHAARRADASTLALPPVFAGIPWSTSQVWPATIRRLRERGHSYAILPAWYDVDEIADLERLRHELQRADSDEALVQLSEAIRAMLE
jgi:glycosyltransferase A (GT-A) superfamily protein (DUF2064 family)